MAVKKAPYARAKIYGGGNRRGHNYAKSSIGRSAKKSHILSTDGLKKRWTVVTDTINSFSFTTKIVVGVMVTALAVACLVSLTKSQLTINNKQKILNELDTKIAQQKLDNDELKDRLDGDLDQYIEAYARENLDMVKPGERVYINTVGD